MSQAPIVFRSRRMRVRRFADDLAYGTTLAGLCYALQLAAAEGEWLVFGLLVALSAVLTVGITLAIRKRKAWIALYQDRIVWRDERGQRHEAPLSTLSVIEPDPFRWGHRIWFREHGALDLSPEFERSNELRNRLQYRTSIGTDLSFGSEPWKAPRRFENQDRVGIGAGIGYAAGFFLIFSGIGAEDLRLVLPGLLALALGLRSTFRMWFERIEIEGDTLIMKSWIPGVMRRIPIHSILGASRTKPSAFAGGVIDTDQGEIRVRSDAKDVDKLIAEAERIGAARFENHRSITERSSTA